MSKNSGYFLLEGKRKPDSTALILLFGSRVSNDGKQLFASGYAIVEPVRPKAILSFYSNDGSGYIEVCKARMVEINSLTNIPQNYTSETMILGKETVLTLEIVGKDDKDEQ
jgi:hypothetical protein